MLLSWTIKTDLGAEVYPSKIKDVKAAAAEVTLELALVLLVFITTSDCRTSVSHNGNRGMLLEYCGQSEKWYFLPTRYLVGSSKILQAYH